MWKSIKIGQLSGKLVAFLLLAAFFTSGCGSVETVKGDVIRIDRKTLKSDSWGYRLQKKGTDTVVLQRVHLCPVQERRVFQEVRVIKESAAISATAGVGCSVTKIGEFSERLFGQPVDRPSNCRGHSSTNREATGRQISESWKTVRHETCGVPQPVSPGGNVRITIIRSRERKIYPIGKGGTVQFSKNDLAKLRIYFTILRDMEIEGQYNGATWRQKLSLE